MKSLKIINRVETNVLGMSVSGVTLEVQNSEYEGMTLQLGDHLVRARLAKKTPTKQGYFVVCWEKNCQNKNQPFTVENSPERLLVNITDGEQSGQFVFSKSILVRKSILSHDDVVGKMAFRVYPIWESNLNQTAKKTQDWQMPYFIDCSQSVLDKNKIAKLF